MSWAQILSMLLQAVVPEANVVTVPLWVVGAFIGIIQGFVAWFLRSLIGDVRALVKQNNELNIKFAVLATEVREIQDDMKEIKDTRTNRRSI